jgi:exopolysaccharide biosynthesis polyprenyl glycosylphosphotransferase
MHAELVKAVVRAYESGVYVTPMANLYEQLTGRIPVEHVGDDWIGAMPQIERLQGIGRVVKRSLDVIGGTVGLLALALLTPPIALAIKLDSPGPVLFRQKRFGFNNERIDVFKFRSLYHDQADPLASKVVTKNDPRVTRVGKFIRKSSLDELPQLFNVVFKNNLSLVGPRPHAVQSKVQSRLYDETVDGYFARHRVKPGITGWAQINGWRGEVDTDEKIQKRVEFDLYYIENWSVLFDLYILLKTPIALLKTENAY